MSCRARAAQPKATALDQRPPASLYQPGTMPDTRLLDEWMWDQIPALRPPPRETPALPPAPAAAEVSHTMSWDIDPDGLVSLQIVYHCPDCEGELTDGDSGTMRCPECPRAVTYAELAQDGAS